MKSITLMISILMCSFICHAQENYNVENIPTALRSRANAIIRNEETVVDMRTTTNVVYTVKQAITVLNKNGENSAHLTLFYDKSTHIKHIKGEVYNAVGQLFKKFTQRDFLDESAVSNFSMYEDNRVKHYSTEMGTYPYTIVYEYEIVFKQNLIIPHWIPKSADDVAVVKSSYTFICKPTDKFRSKTQNLILKPEESLINNQKITTWRVNNLPALKAEPYRPVTETYQIFVKIAPEEFSYYNHQANYKNWQELGKWIYDDLLKERTLLTASTISTIKELVKLEKTDKDKARKIYQYLQNKTRYISVQIGIGGFKPFSASEVDRLGYGDCKALVNYMQSLLKAVEIDSYYCVVNAGDEKKSLDPTFASMTQANHVILCIPLAGDTTWLECTSQTIPFGFLSSFTDDRLVLACTPNGGKILRTPKYATQQNLESRVANLFLNKNGNLTGEVSTTFTGTKYDNRAQLIEKTPTEQEKLLHQLYPIDHINFNAIKYIEKKDILPQLQENLKVDVEGYGAVNNQKIFLLLNPFHLKLAVQEVRNRTMPVYINRGYSEEDRINYTLGDTINPLIEPLEKSYQTKFGSYHLKTSLNGNIISHYRKFSLNEGNFEAADYEDFAKFMNDVNAADQLRLVLSLK